MEIVQRKDLPEDYAEMMQTEAHHDHVIIRDDNGTLRWKENPDALRLWKSLPNGLNDLIPIFHGMGYDKNSEVLRQFYRDIGYSLSGYWEILYWELNNADADEYVPQVLRPWGGNYIPHKWKHYNWKEGVRRTMIVEAIKDTDRGTWTMGEIRDLMSQKDETLLDSDVVDIVHEDEYNSDNLKSGAHTALFVYRWVPITDMEIAEYQIDLQQSDRWLKERRRATYEKLKKEFENED